MASKKRSSYADIDPKSVLKYLEDAAESMETMTPRRIDTETLYFPVSSIARHARSRKGRRLTRMGLEDDVETLLDELVKEGKAEKASVMNDMVKDADEEKTTQSILMPVPTRYKFNVTVGYRKKKK